MVFKSTSGKRQESVYDPKSETFIADFVDGQFSTENAVVGERLVELGYQRVDVDESVASPDVHVEPVVAGPVVEDSPVIPYSQKVATPTKKKRGTK